MKQLFARWCAAKKQRKNGATCPPSSRAGHTSTHPAPPAPYPAMLHPFPGRSFADLTPAEAQTFLDWHIAHLSERIRILADYASAEGSAFVPDGTPQSLETLWAWMEGHIHLRERTDEEMAREIEKAPDWFKEIAAQHTHTLSNETLDLVWDCSVYFAHVMLTNHPGLTWQLCKTRRNPCFQMPVIGGFPHHMQMEPALIVTNIARLSAKASNPGQLLETYRFWEGYLP